MCYIYIVWSFQSQDMTFLYQVNVTAFEASPKCSSNPLPEHTPATLAPGEWEESQWASNATVRPDPRPVWQKSVEPPKKDWNDFVWSAEKVRACDKP